MEKRRTYSIRRAARAVIFTEQYEIALMYSRKNSYYKLPGGGVEEGEDIMAALHREVLEETGRRVDVVGDIGMVVEYRDQHSLLQISYAFLCLVKDHPITMELLLTAEEQEERFEVCWMPADEALDRLLNQKAEGYVRNFMIKRDAILTGEAVRLLEAYNKVLSNDKN